MNSGTKKRLRTGREGEGWEDLGEFLAAAPPSGHSRGKRSFNSIAASPLLAKVDGIVRGDAGMGKGCSDGARIAEN